jgi:hypothetical protein
LIINVTENTVNLHKAGCIALLERVLEASLKINIKNNPRTILFFLIRYYKETGTPLRTHEDYFRSKMEDFWKKIKKPVGEEMHHWSVRFDVMVYGIPDLSPEGFIDREYLMDLPKFFFDENYNNFLFKNNNGRGKNLEMWELNTLIPQIWNNIINNKDLNMLSERESLSLHRCDEIRKELLEKMKIDLGIIKDDILRTEKIPDDINERINKIENSIIKEFEERAPHLIRNIYEDKLSELKNIIRINHLEIDQHKTRIENHIIKQKEKKKIESEVKKTEEGFEKYKEAMNKMIERLKLMDENYNKILKDLENQMKDLKDLENQMKERVRLEQETAKERNKSAEDKIKIEKEISEMKLKEKQIENQYKESKFSIEQHIKEIEKVRKKVAEYQRLLLHYNEESREIERRAHEAQMAMTMPIIKSQNSSFCVIL